MDILALPMGKPNSMNDPWGLEGFYQLAKPMFWGEVKWYPSDWGVSPSCLFPLQGHRHVRALLWSGGLTRQCRSDGIDCRGLDLLKNRYHDLTTPEGLLEWILTGELGPFQLCFCVGYAHGSSSIPGLWSPWRRSWGFADLVSSGQGIPAMGGLE